MKKEERVRSVTHLKFISTLPCCITFGTEVQAAHISEGRNSIALKSGDNMTVPLHWRLHALQHSVGEEKFWMKYGGIEKAKKMALDLWENTGDHQKCTEIIRRFMWDF